MESSESNLYRDREPRILILSQRELVDQVANSCLYDFEDLIGEFDRVDLIAPQPSIHISRKFTSAKSLLPKNVPFTYQFILEQDYDLLFVVVDNPWQLITINSIKNWQQKCRKIVCHIGEVWSKDIQDKRIIQDLQMFDWIFLSVSHCTEEITRLTERPCTYLPPAVNTIQFSAYLKPLPRSIDICYIGRRSPVTHQSILDYAAKHHLFYYYDTAKEMKIVNHREHRHLFANLVKRSRYFLANYAKIDKFEETSGKQEIGYRFFEGIAGGTVMLGQPPVSETFQEHFDWEDAIIPIPVDVENIGEIINELDRQPERLDKISRDNTINALLRHDWVYRWKTILNSLGLSYTEEMSQRESLLKNLATSLRSSN